MYKYVWHFQDIELLILVRNIPKYLLSMIQTIWTEPPFRRTSFLGSTVQPFWYSFIIPREDLNPPLENPFGSFRGVFLCLCSSCVVPFVSFHCNGSCIMLLVGSLYQVYHPDTLPHNYMYIYIYIHIYIYVYTYTYVYIYIYMYT